MLVHEHISGGGLAGDPPMSWLAEGSAMRRALARDLAASGARVLMNLDARLTDDPGPWEPIRVEPGSAAESLILLARRVDLIMLIAPETGGTLRDLSRKVVGAGGRAFGCSTEAIDLAADKSRLADHFRREGIPTPEVLIVHPEAELPKDFRYPAVLKPIDGAGSLDTYFIAGPEAMIPLPFPYDRGLLQPFLSGEPRSATFLGSPGSPPTLIGVARQQISLDRGRFSYQGGTILLEDLASGHPARLAAMSVPGLGGLFGIDYIHDPATGCAEVLEINPRPTTSCVGLVDALGAGRLGAAWLTMSRTKALIDSKSIPWPTRTVTFRSDETIALGSSCGLPNRASE